MKIGLCLSGGGIKGAAHIGALKALEEENIKIDCIAGTSSGSIVSAMYAMGYKPEKIYELFKRYGKEVSKINFTTIMKLVFGLIFRRKIIIEGLNSGKSLYKIVQEQANKKSINQIKDIKMPLIIPSVNLYNGEIYLFSSLEQNRTYSDEYIVENNIEIGKAVQASCSYPGVFCPTNYKGKKMVDGGLRENTPWKELQQIGADKIISIVFEKEKESKRKISMIDCIIDSLGIVMHELYNYEIEGIDYILKVKTEDISLLDTSMIECLYRIGYNQTKKQMKDIKKYLYNT